MAFSASIVGSRVDKERVVSGRNADHLVTADAVGFRWTRSGPLKRGLGRNPGSTLGYISQTKYVGPPDDLVCYPMGSSLTIARGAWRGAGILVMCVLLDTPGSCSGQEPRRRLVEVPACESAQMTAHD
jgi:hypothetical protein